MKITRKEILLRMFDVSAILSLILLGIGTSLPFIIFMKQHQLSIMLIAVMAEILCALAIIYYLAERIFRSTLKELYGNEI